jgi:hypothetical protein
MENAKPKSNRKSVAVKDLRTQIIDQYLDFVLTEGRRPNSVYQLMKQLGQEETVFYEHFSTFTELEDQLWQEFATETISRLHQEPVYNEYSGREKLLAFYFTLLEVLKPKRSFVNFSLSEVKKPELMPAFLKGFREKYTDFVKDLIRESIDKGEIVDRPLVGSRYDEGLWVQFLFILNFWLRDRSLKFEKTDAAIEKSVHLSFDLMGRSFVDSFVDLGKFIVQNRN